MTSEIYHVCDEDGNTSAEWHFEIKQIEMELEIAIYFGMTGLPIRLLVTTRRCQLLHGIV